MTVHLLDAHPGRHRAHRARPSRPHPVRRLRVLLEVIELWTRWWNWPPVQAYYYRQWRRADRKAFAAEMAALQATTPGDELGAPDEDGLNRYRTEPLPPESYPYPQTELPQSWPWPSSDKAAMVPRTLGDGVIVNTPDGCIQIRRPEWTRTRDTSFDLHAVPEVRPYLDAMPGGTE